MEEEDLGFLTNLSSQTASVIEGVLEMDTANDEDAQAAQSNALGLKRARALSRLAIGRVFAGEVERTIRAKDDPPPVGDTNTTVAGARATPAVTDLSLEGVRVETVHSDKACGIITTDTSQGVTIVASEAHWTPWTWLLTSAL